MDIIELNNGINLHILQTDKFKSLSIVIILRNPLNRETVTLNSLIPHILAKGSKKYKTYKEIVLKTEEMYGAVFDTNIIKKGEEHIIQFYLETLNTGTCLENGIEFLSEIILNPLVNNNGFSEQVTSLEKENLRLVLKNKINNKKEYAVTRCIEEMFAGEPFGIEGSGYEEDIDKITPQNLYSHYNNILAHAPMDIIIVGDVTTERAKNSINNYINVKRREINLLPVSDIKKPKDTANEIKETEDLNQGKLCIGITTNICNSGHNYYSMLVLNSILGGSASSKLFQNIREEEGLCYYINSVIYRFKMIMLIQAGIDVSNYDKTLQLIRKQIDEIKNGLITDKEIEVAKKSLKKQFESTKDSQGALIDFYMTQYLLNDKDAIIDMQHNINMVSKEDIINAAENLKMDTIYFLTKEGN